MNVNTLLTVAAVIVVLVITLAPPRTAIEIRDCQGAPIGGRK